MVWINFSEHTKKETRGGKKSKIKHENRLKKREYIKYMDRYTILHTKNTRKAYMMDIMYILLFERQACFVIRPIKEWRNRFVKVKIKLYRIFY